MINKTKRLKAIGKYYDFSGQSNDLDWHKNTFIFAPNAYGKSTLVDVLRSLCNNDPKLICARTTLGASALPEAVIVIDRENYVFTGTRWERPLSSIKIFDVPFIHTNILSHEIGHEHKKNIHRIIIGQQGILLAEELTDLKKREKEKSQYVTNLVKQFNQSGITLSLDTFLTIAHEEEADVELRIQKLQQDIKSKESEKITQNLIFPVQANAPSFDLSPVKELAAKKLAGAHEVAEKQVLSHINRNFKDKAQAKHFIRLGIDLIQADCPFCGQDLSNVAHLLKAYQAFFDDAFRDYQQDLAKQILSLARWNLDNELTALVSTHNANLTAVSQWELYLGTTGLPDVTVTVERYRATLIESKDMVLSELDKKQKDPNVDVELSYFEVLSTELAELQNAIKSYNADVTAFTEKAQQYVANLPKSDVASLRAALEKDQQIKIRFTPEWKKWAIDYLEAKSDANDLLARKDSKQVELKNYSQDIFDTYQQRINELLVTLGTDFTITGLTGRTDGRANESYSEFGFLILQQTVPLTTRQDDTPCFKNTLSEGDKSTLAFAFFIATLEKTPELDKQIVVFDDPLSSLDETRREATARLLLDLSPTVNQLCVFTHKKDFLYMLCDKMPDNKNLRVRFDKKNGSRLESFDVEQDRKGEYGRIIEDMERYVVDDFGPSPETMQGNIRKVFEVVLKTKYYRVLTDDIKLKKGLAKLFETLFGAGQIDIALKPRLFDLCNITNGPHHGEIVDAPSKKLTRDELIPLINEALGLLEKV